MHFKLKMVSSVTEPLFFPIASFYLFMYTKVTVNYDKNEVNQVNLNLEIRKGKKD